MSGTRCAQKKGCFVWRCFKRLVKITIVALILAVPAAYFGLPALAKTAWGRGKAEKALAAVAGGPVHVDSVAVSWKQGVTLSNVRVDAVDRGGVETSGTIRELVFAPAGKSLLCKTTRARAIVREPKLLVRDIRGEESAATPRAAAPPCALKHSARKPLSIESIVIENGSVTFDGSAYNEPVQLTSLNLHASVRVSTGNVTLEVRELKAMLNGGEISAHGTLCVDSGRTTGKLDLSAADVELTDAIVQVLRRVVPAFEVAPGGDVHGTVTARVALEGPVRTPSGSAEIAVNGRLAGARIFHALAGATGESRLAMVEFTQVRGHLQVADGEVTHVATELRQSLGAARLSGVVHRDGSMDMFLVCDHEVVHEMNGKAEATLLEGVRIGGTAAQPILFLD